jgi:hypothetical protein
MKKTVTYTSIIITTLLIGFIIGFLVSGRLAKKRIQKMRSDFREQGFNRKVMRALDPTPEQMEQLRPILKKHAKMQKEMMSSMRASQDALFSEFRADVQPYLTEEQVKKLDRMHEKFKRRVERDGPDRRYPDRKGKKKK